MTTKEATICGVQAFKKGKGGAPYQNQGFLHDMYKFLNSKQNTEKLNSIDLMKAYIHGWDIANLANGIDDDTMPIWDIANLANGIDDDTMPSVIELKKILA